MKVVKIFLLVTTLLYAVHCYQKHDIEEFTSNITYYTPSLAGSNQTGEGRLMLSYNGSQLYVCSSHMTFVTAKTLCRILGYSWSGQFNIISDGRYGRVKGQPVVSHIDCHGKETSLKQCNITTKTSSSGCLDSGYAQGLDCVRSYIKLVDGPGKWSGRLEFDYNDLKGTVCQKDFDNTDATVACKMLFRQSGVTGIKMGNIFGESRHSKSLGYVDCKGNEDDLAKCLTFYRPGSKTFKKNCDPSQAVGVECRGDAAVRLVGGGSTAEGRVEVQVNGIWGPVCQISTKDAQVICRTLGYWYPAPVVHDSSVFGPGSKQHAVASLNCDGIEPDIGICQWYNDSSRCSPTNHPGVSCYAKDLPSSPSKIRLIGDYRAWRGRVEIRPFGPYYGKYGTLHATNTHNNTAEPICRTLGYRWVGHPYYYSSIPPLPSYHLLESLSCNGSEQNIGHCMSTGDRYPSADRDALNVDCIGNSTRVRLVNGSHPLEGRVEILYNGQWGTVCDSDWGFADTTVVCRSLGIETTSFRYYYNAYFGEGSGPIHFTNMDCKDYYGHIAQCPSQNGSSCVHSEDISVSCSDCTQIHTSFLGEVSSGKFASECVYIIKPRNTLRIFKLNVTSVETNSQYFHRIQIRDRLNGNFLGEYTEGGSVIIAANGFWVHYKTVEPSINSFILNWNVFNLEDAVAVNCTEESWDVSVNITNLGQLYATLHNPQNIYLGECNTPSRLADGALYMTPSLSDCHTLKRIHGNDVIYNNSLTYREAPGDVRWRVPIQCKLSRDSSSQDEPQ